MTGSTLKFLDEKTGKKAAQIPFQIFPGDVLCQKQRGVFGNKLINEERIKKSGPLVSGLRLDFIICSRSFGTGKFTDTY